MSRNFEILHRGGVAQVGALSPATLPHAPAGKSVRPQERRGAAEDEITKLVQRLFVYPATTNPPSAVAFCAVDEGAGCSWVCARASEALAGQVPGRVCLVDANLRSPFLHEHFGAESRPGFTEAMKDSAPIRDFVRATWCSHLWLMTSGTVDAGPNGTLNPDRLRARISDLRSEFDYVLLDTPPLSPYPDALLLGRAADGVVLVIESNSTRRESARVAKEGLEAARIPILGAVLNQRTYPIPEALYKRL